MVDRAPDRKGDQKRIDREDFLNIHISPIEKIDLNYEDDFDLAEIIWQGINALKRI